MRARHSHVTLKGRSARKYLFIGGCHMGMGSEYRTDSSVEMPSHYLHVASGFGVKVNNDQPNVIRDFGQHAVRGFPWTVNGAHEDASLQADDGD